MRIVVCIKHVPDIHGERALGADGRMVRGGDDVLNELDEHAVATAVAIAAQHRADGHGSDVIAVTVGPLGAVAALRRALQLGAHRAVHVSDEAIAGSDVVGTAAVLAATVRRLAGEEPVDLVVTAMASLDGLTSMVPAILAAALDLPQLTLAAAVDVTDAEVSVERSLDAVEETLRAPLPALVSVTDQAPGPGVPDVMAMLAARKTPVTTWSLADIGLAPHEVGAAGSAVVVSEASPRSRREGGRIVVDEGDGGIELAEFVLDRLGR